MTEVVWVSSKDYARQLTRREPLKEVQIEELRLIADDQWFAAQVLLAKEAKKAAGRKPRDSNLASRPRLLNGLFYCPAHNRKLYVGGVHGKYLVCRDCRGLPAEQRPLFSQLPRALALRKTCEALAARIREDTDLVARVIVSCQRHAAKQQAPDPERITGLEARRAKLDQRIGFVLRNPGDTDTDQAESQTELCRLRKLRAEVQAELDAVRATASVPIRVPTEDELRVLIGKLETVLVASASPDSGVEGQVRDLIDLLTGGRIDLLQVGERKAHRGWLQGQFRFRLVEAIAREATRVEINSVEFGPMVCIDYRAEPAAIAESVIKTVTELYESGVLVKEIARRTELPRSAVARILDDWYAGRGLERPDGRTRRSGLTIKHVDAPTYRAVSDRVKELADRGLLFGAIAQELDLDRNTVTAAWCWWHESRGLPVPDGRARRKALRLGTTGTEPGQSLGAELHRTSSQIPSQPEPPNASCPDHM